MSHLEAILAELEAAAGVTALVGTSPPRIWPLKAPQRPVAPFIILTDVSAVPEHTMTGAPAELLENARVQVSIYAGGPGKAGYKTALQVAAAVDDVLGALSRPDLSVVRLNSRGLYDDATELSGVAVDYSVWRGRDG